MMGGVFAATGLRTHPTPAQMICSARWRDLLMTTVGVFIHISHNRQRRCSRSQALRYVSGSDAPEVGLLDHRTNAAHCIHLDDEDIRRCGRAGITVAHSPIGNAKSGDAAPILELREAAAVLLPRTDTMSGDRLRRCVGLFLTSAFGKAVASAGRQSCGRLGHTRSGGWR